MGKTGLSFLSISRSEWPDLVQARARLQDRQGILLDWDGCVALGDKPHADGIKFVTKFQSRIAIVSNNSTLRPQDICAILKKAGLTFPSERVILAGHQALVRAAQLHKPTLVLGSLQMKSLARELGIEQVTRNPEVVVLLRDTRFSYARLHLAINALIKGGQLIVSNPDLSHPGVAGAVVPETGALLASILACVPPHVLRMDVVGKPNAPLFQTACAALGIAATQAIMIGDNPSTDIAGARQYDMESILVSPGSSLNLADLC
jgi:HAD superfamily hydrolase (TIGR01450 family)